jgi:F-type H+-transporting ATPase subunit delta
MLASPIIREDKKLSIMKEVFENYVSSDSINFIEFVINKGREEFLFPIYKKFIELRDEKLGFINIDVTSAIELSDVQIDLINKKLEDYTGKKVRTKLHTNENLIGGFFIKIKDTVLDASVKHQLELLRKTLLKEKTTVS